MKEIQGRITVSRHAVGQEVKRGNSAEKEEILLKTLNIVGTYG